MNEYTNPFFKQRTTWDTNSQKIRIKEIRKTTFPRSSIIEWNVTVKIQTDKREHPRLLWSFHPICIWPCNSHTVLSTKTININTRRTTAEREIYTAIRNEWLKLFKGTCWGLAPCWAVHTTYWSWVIVNNWCSCSCVEGTWLFSSFLLWLWVVYGLIILPLMVVYHPAARWVIVRI